ncbi:polyprenyl synthetase family protein [Acetatifactor muris]|uniref:polyprenyl synthetase family protein n=1 Tax=Acetatifactor muris TaxID=879566 RepID=UPI0023EFBFAC|nr:polyprenyl synthetase family protein [Acetatifactor muris]
MNTNEFDSRLKEAAGEAEEILRRFLPEETGLQRELFEAMNYSLTAGGKRLRPILMRETYRMCGGTDEYVIGCFMAAIEMIHTYSLVHDDLPAMDNDQYRRGRETTWYVYGDAMGILAGDGLLNYAFETALKAAKCPGGECGSFFDASAGEGKAAAGNCPDGGKPAGEHSDSEALSRMMRIWRALSVLAGKAGAGGMIGGQTVDILAEGGKPEEMTEEKLLFIHRYKTAALIQAAMMVGAILAGASEEQVADIEKCAADIGIAFQIQDDILDVVGDSRELGKPVGSDAQNHKQTYVTLKGMEQSKADVEKLSLEATAILDGFPGEHTFLKQLILTLIHRSK